MKTNRFFLVTLAIAGMMMTACSNDEAVEMNNATQAISFHVQGGTPTTTLRTNATTLGNLEAFVVYGTDDVLAPGELLFNGVTVARQQDGTFDYNPKKYYSEDAKEAGFFAYAPVSADVTPNVVSFLGGASFDYTVPTPNKTGNITQEDLLVAGKAVPTPDATPVHLHFEHALSRIFVTAENATVETIVIKRLILRNLYSTATLKVAPACTWSWANFDDLTNYEYVLAETGVAVPVGIAVPTPVTSMEQGMMVLPQVTLNDNDDDVVDADDFTLRVVYDFGGKQHTKDILLTDGYEFESGKQYTINIAFTGHMITFTVSVHPFENGPAVTYP